MNNEEKHQQDLFKLFEELLKKVDLKEVCKEAYKNFTEKNLEKKFYLARRIRDLIYLKVTNNDTFKKVFNNETDVELEEYFDELLFDFMLKLLEPEILMSNTCVLSAIKRKGLLE